MTASASPRASWLPPAVRRRLDPGARFGLRVTLAAGALLLLALPFAFLLLQVRRSGPLLAVDRSVAQAMYSVMRDREVLTAAMRAVTAIGTMLGMGILVGAGAVVLTRAGRRRLRTFLLVTSIGAWLLNNSVKLLVGRQRPSFDDPLATAHGLSFPSGHAMNSAAVLGALLVVFLPAVRPSRRPPVVAATVALILVIGFTRLALGVHYLTDVVAGFVLGAAWLSACVAAFSIWREERGRPAGSPMRGLEPESGPDLRAAAAGDVTDS